MANATKSVPYDIQVKKVSHLINNLKSDILNIRLQSAEKLGYYSQITPDEIKAAIYANIKNENDYHVRFYSILSLKNIQNDEIKSNSLDTNTQNILKVASKDICSDIRFQASIDMSKFNLIHYVNKSLRAAGFNNTDTFYTLEEPAKGRPKRRLFLDSTKLLQAKSKLLPMLLKQLDQNDTELKLGAIHILNTMKNLPPEGINKYISLSRSQDPHIRLNILNGSLPIDSYIQALNDDYWLIRKMAAFHLSKQTITPKIANALIKNFNDSIADVAIFAVDAFYNVKPEDHEVISIALPALIEALKSEYWKLQLNVAHILGKFEHNATPALPVLISVLRSAKIIDKNLPQPNYGNLESQEDIQITILNTIEKMGSDAKEAIPHLKWAVKQKHLHDDAVRALKVIENGE